MNRRWLFACLTGALLTALAASCTGQGEGQRCQSANNNDDCQSGLVCGKAKTSSGTNFEVCCPPAGQTASDPLCIEAPPSPGSDASITDGASTDTGSNDGQSDATSDAADASDTGTTDSGDASSDATGQ